MENDVIDIKQIVIDLYSAKLFILVFTLLVFLFSTFFYTMEKETYNGEIKITSLDPISNKYNALVTEEQLYEAFKNNIFRKNIIKDELKNSFLEENNLDNFENILIIDLFNSLKFHSDDVEILTVNSANKQIVKSFLELLVINTNAYVKEISIDFAQSNVDNQLYQQKLLSEIRELFKINDELGDDFQLVQFMFDNVSDRITSDLDNLQNMLQIFKKIQISK